MPLVSLRQLLDDAAEHRYGLPAININNMEQVQAVLGAAREVDSPAIVAASAGARTYAGEPFLRHLILAALEVDGGVSEAVAPDLVRRGATVLVAGSAVHRHPSGRGAAIQGLREAALSGAERNHRPAADLPADAAMPTGRSAGRQRGAS